MKWMILFVIAFTILASLGLASTRTVDGVGGAPLTFASIKEALINLGVSADNGDGTTDTISVTANIIEINGFCVAADGFSHNDGYGSGVYQALSDEIIIDGGSHVVSIIRGAEGGGDPLTDMKAAVLLYFGSGSLITLRNMTLMPYTSVTTDSANTAILIEDRNGASLSGFEINLENVAVTGNDGSGNPLNKTASLPAAPNWIQFGSKGPGAIVRILSNSGADAGTINIDNCDILYSKNNGFYADVLETDFNLTNTFIRGTYDGFEWFDATGSTITMNGCTSRDNARYGCNITSGTLDSMDYCYFIGNQDIGFKTQDWAKTKVNAITNCVFTDNLAPGLVLSGLDVSLGTPLIEKCLLANNGSSDKSALVRIDPANSGALKTITLTDCTFHNPANGPLGGIILVAINPSCNNVKIDIRDSIFSGSTGDSVALNYMGGTGLSWELTNCAMVTNGPYAITGLQDATAVSGVISPYNDPLYKGVNTNPADSNSFVVQNDVYGTAGTGGAPLEGWGGYDPLLTGIGDWFQFTR